MIDWHKINAAIEYLKTCGVREEFLSPWWYRLLWFFHVPIAPPLFQKLLPFVLVNGAISTFVYSILTAALILVTLYRGGSLFDRLSTFAVVLLTIYSLIIFIWGYLRWYASVLDLPAWEDFDPGPDDSESTL